MSEWERERDSRRGGREMEEFDYVSISYMHHCWYCLFLDGCREGDTHRPEVLDDVGLDFVTAKKKIKQ